MHDPIDPSPITEIHLPIYAGRGRNRKIVAFATVLNDAFSRDVLKKMSWIMVHGHPATSALFSSGTGPKSAYLHQLVFQEYHGPLPPGRQVDHRDRDRLNARPDNLRAASMTLQRANTGLRKDNKLGFKGISETANRTGRKYYVAQVKKNAKYVLQRLFPYTPAGKLEAARAVNEAYREWYPDVTIPNPEAELN